jgi:hypothetical protein
MHGEIFPAPFVIDQDLFEAFVLVARLSPARLEFLEFHSSSHATVNNVCI